MPFSQVRVARKVYVTKRVVALPSHDPGAKTLEQIIHKVISYTLYVRQLKQRNNYDLDCIIAIDETAVWHEMISNATVTDKGPQSVVLKTTGHEKSKVTVTLAAKANGDKLKPYIVFPGHKPEVQNLKKDPAIKNRCYVESTINGWVNEDTIIDWVENVLKIFNFGKRRLFARDSFRAHLVQSVKELLNKGKIDLVLFPGGTTGHIQAADVSWNKPIKDQPREMYDQWMEERPHTHTKGGNMRGPPLKQIVQILIKRLLLNYFVAVLCQYRMMGVRTTKLHVSNQENH